MNLKELMGDAFKDGITVEEITSFFEGKKFADLGTGQYVDKNKYENAVNDLNQKLTDANNQLSAKMTDDEKLQKAQQEKDKEIERLQKLLSDNTINGNRNTVTSVLASTRETLGIELTDSEFTKFVEYITTEDSTKSTDIATYVSKVVKDAYEKGKQDATKDAMGNFGKGAGQSDSGSSDDIGKLGSELANVHKNKNNKKTYDYFNKK